jgi:hypothetical protein
MRFYHLWILFGKGEIISSIKDYLCLIICLLVELFSLFCLLVLFVPCPVHSVALEKAVFEQISLPCVPIACVLDQNLYMHEYAHILLILTMKMEAAHKCEISEALYAYARCKDQEQN